MLVGLAASLVVGCSQGTDVPLAKVPEVKAPPSAPPEKKEIRGMPIGTTARAKMDPNKSD